MKLMMLHFPVISAKAGIQTPSPQSLSPTLIGDLSPAMTGEWGTKMKNLDPRFRGDDNFICLYQLI
jgi:hypothetical protein